MLTEKFELVLSMLDNPKEAIELIIVEKPVFLSLIIFVLANLSFVISNSISSGIGQNALILKLIFVPLLSFLFLIIATCGLHFIAEILNGRGNVSAFFTLLSFSLTPTLLLIPASIISNFTSVWFTYFSTIIIFFWTVYLVITSIKMVYNIPTDKAVAVIISPAIILSLVFFIFFILSIIGIFSFLTFSI